ncbi:MAG: DUF2062 domain-containing protein [Alphaproteobacteria bacterium]
MVFKRRDPLAWYQHLKEWVWPSAGWSRMFQYLTHRVVRIPGSSYSIACGLAFGAAVSFTPFIGLHFLISMGLAWLFRANVIAAAIGTVVGNPWTFPFIWVATYQTGSLILGAEGSLDITEVLRNFKLFDDPYGSLKPVFLPLILGSIPYVLISWAAVFFPAREFIEIRKARRAKKKAKQ